MCAESPFQSDALLVPSPCIFDHIHNASTCLETKAWNVTAKKSCDARNMELKSYAILLPCGVGLFAGVEFVCCPVDKGTAAAAAAHAKLQQQMTNKNSFSHDLGVFSSSTNSKNNDEILDDDDDEVGFCILDNTTGSILLGLSILETCNQIFAKTNLYARFFMLPRTTMTRMMTSTMTTTMTMTTSTTMTLGRRSSEMVSVWHSPLPLTHKNFNILI